MSRLARSSSARRLGVVVLLLTSGLSACHSWHTEPVTPRAAVESQYPERIRATLKNHTQLELHEAEIGADTIYGWVGDREEDRRRIGIPLASVEQVAVLRPDHGETAMAVVSGAAGAFLLFAALTLAINPPD